MTIPVYSTNFITVHGLNGTRSYSVPAGYIVVLRDLDVYYGGGLGAATVFLQNGLGAAIWSNAFGALASGQYASWRGRQVINNPYSVSIVTDSPMDVMLSGYLLTAP